MGHFRGLCVGSVGVLGLQLLLVACGDTTKDAPSPGTSAADAGSGADAGRSGNSNRAGATSSGGSANAGGNSASAGSGTASDLDSFLAGEGVGFCARLFRCIEGNDDFSSQQLLLKTEQGCKDLLARVNASSVDLRDLRAQIDAGNVHYDPEQGQRCLTDLSACNGTASLYGSTCRDAFEGSAKTGEACQRSADCVGDAYCNITNACPGQCAPRLQEGEPCRGDRQCSYTTGYVFCDDSLATAVCRTLPLAAKVGEGMPCTRRLQGATSLTLCQDAFWCATVAGGDPGADSLGRCAAPIALGSACVDSDDVCSGGMCDSVAGVCQAVTLVAKAGAACDKAARLICDPTLGLHCNAAGTCDSSGDGSEGSVCYTGDLQWGCDPGLFCAKAPQATSDVPGTCRALLGDGEACERSDSCLTGNCAAGVCGGRPCSE